YVRLNPAPPRERRGHAGSTGGAGTDLRRAGAHADEPVQAGDALDAVEAARGLAVRIGDAVRARRDREAAAADQLDGDAHAEPERRRAGEPAGEPERYGRSAGRGARDADGRGVPGSGGGHEIDPAGVPGAARERALLGGLR